jgi:sulfite reductase beta subunit-like hemoprotein
MELGGADVGTVRDVVSCPGMDYCSLAITRSMGMAERIQGHLSADADTANGFAERLGPFAIKISGCPNSCGQHHLASIGLYGGARKFHGEAAPAYQLLVGGHVGSDTRFAKPLARVPARLVPDAVRTLLTVYRRDRERAESFVAFATRIGADRLAELVSPWTELPPAIETPDAYLDWGADRKFTPETGPGECAA